MDFETMDAKGYRLLNSDLYSERRSLVLDLAEAIPEDATEEQIRSIDAELDIIKAEDSRRDALIEARNHKAAEVIGGAGNIIESIESEKEEREMPKTLGERVLAEVEERGYKQGERFVVSNIAFRAATDTQLNPVLTGDYGADTLDDVDLTIREGYRRPFVIADLFGSESTAKEAVSFYVEGAVEGAPAMTAEAGKYSQIHFGEPQKQTNALKKVTAFWKASDELLSDSPRFVSHINGRAPYLMDYTKEEQLISGDGTGNNITGLLNTNGIGAETYTAIDLSFIDSLLEYNQQIQEATPNFNADALLVSNADYRALMTLKNSADQYVFGGPVNIVYGQNANVSPVVWSGIRIVPTAALTAGTMVLGAFKRGATVVNHVEGRRFETAYDGEDFTHGLVTFRTSERFTLAVEYPGAFVKLTK